MHCLALAGIQELSAPIRPLAVVFTALFGLAFGSFANVCISRLPRRESIVRPASRCPRCRRPIPPLENIPLVSWFALRGRCHGCGATIPVRYPLVEAATAALWVACLLRFGLTPEGAGAAVLCWFLVALSATDAETLLLPNALTFPALALGVVFSMVKAAAEAGLRAAARAGARAAAAAFCAALLLLLIRAVYWSVRRRTGLGLGDVKLFAAIAAWMGAPQAALVFFLAVVTGAIYGVLRTLLAPATGEREPVRVPLGAFLCLAAAYALFFGQASLRWYLGFFS